MRRTPDTVLSRLAVGGLGIEALFDLAGTFAASAALQATLWAIDSVALVAAAPRIALHLLPRHPPDRHLKLTGRTVCPTVLPSLAPARQLVRERQARTRAGVLFHISEQADFARLDPRPSLKPLPKDRARFIGSNPAVGWRSSNATPYRGAR
jgi:hypothetical protein